MAFLTSKWMPFEWQNSPFSFAHRGAFSAKWIFCRTFTVPSWLSISTESGFKSIDTLEHGSTLPQSVGNKIFSIFSKTPLEDELSYVPNRFVTVRPSDYRTPIRNPQTARRLGSFQTSLKSPLFKSGRSWSPYPKVDRLGKSYRTYVQCPNFFRVLDILKKFFRFLKKNFQFAPYQNDRAIR